MKVVLTHILIHLLPFQEHIRQSREQQLNELDKHDPYTKKPPPHDRSSSSPSSSHEFEAANAVDSNCYVPGGEMFPILTRDGRSLSPPDDSYPRTIYTVDNDNPPEMCDMACQTRESLFTTQAYSSNHSTPSHSVHSNSTRMSPPAPFSTFGYKKGDRPRDTKFRAEAKIEMTAMDKKKQHVDRPYSVQTTKSAPDVIVTH